MVSLENCFHIGAHNQHQTANDNRTQSTTSLFSPKYYVFYSVLRFVIDAYLVCCFVWQKGIMGCDKARSVAFIAFFHRADRTVKTVSVDRIREEAVLWIDRASTLLYPICRNIGLSRLGLMVIAQDAICAFICKVKKMLHQNSC